MLPPEHTPTNIPCKGAANASHQDHGIDNILEYLGVVFGLRRKDARKVANVILHCVKGISESVIGLLMKLAEGGLS